MTLGALIWIAFGLVTLAGVVGIVHHHVVPRERQARGTEPGRGDQLLHAKERVGFIGAANEDAAGRVWRVTRDPQEYAKGFVPAKQRRETK